MSSVPPRAPRLRVLMIAVLAAATAPVLPGADVPEVHARLVLPLSMVPGSKGRIVAALTLGSGWHVNSHTPSEAFLIPTNLTLAASTGTLSPVRYPADVERRFAFSDKPLKVYEGAVNFEIDLELPPTAVGEVSISGSLSYQACNDRQCFPPAAIPLTATIRIQSSH